MPRNTNSSVNTSSRSSVPHISHLEGQSIDSGRLLFKSKLGTGAYGVVYLAQDVSSRSTSQFYAIKCLSKIGLDERQRKFQKRELMIHSLAGRHSNIVTLHAIHETSNSIYVVMDYLKHGDLFTMITEKQAYIGKDEIISRVFDQILEAVQHCHEIGVAHRDLKPENILVAAEGGRRVVLADFGLATTEKISADLGCGSSFYMSPECQGATSYLRNSSGEKVYATQPNDIWSLGVILINMTCSRNPWKQATAKDDTFEAYRKDQDAFLPKILPISSDAHEVLRRVFSIQPDRRPTISELRVMCSKVKRWTMTREELRYATRATREAARAVFGDDLSLMDQPNEFHHVSSTSTKVAAIGRSLSTIVDEEEEEVMEIKKPVVKSPVLPTTIASPRSPRPTRRFQIPSPIKPPPASAFVSSKKQSEEPLLTECDSTQSSIDSDYEHTKARNHPSNPQSPIRQSFFRRGSSFVKQSLPQSNNATAQQPPRPLFVTPPKISHHRRPSTTSESTVSSDSSSSLDEDGLFTPTKRNFGTPDTSPENSPIKKSFNTRVPVGLDQAQPKSCVSFPETVSCTSEGEEERSNWKLYMGWMLGNKVEAS